MLDFFNEFWKSYLDILAETRFRNSRMSILESQITNIHKKEFLGSNFKYRYIIYTCLFEYHTAV